MNQSLDQLSVLNNYLDTAEYQVKIVPCVVKLFSGNNRNARYKLLSQVESFVEHLPNKIVNDQVFPKIEQSSPSDVIFYIIIEEADTYIY